MILPNPLPSSMAGEFGLDSFPSPVQARPLLRSHSSQIDKFESSLPSMLPLTLSPSQREDHERTRSGSFLSDDSDGAPVAPPVASRVALRTYSQQLEEYITRFRCRPPDIKFWPYGPYWPKDHEGVKLDTPKFLTAAPLYSEPKAPRLQDEDENSRTVDNQTTAYNARWRGTLIVYDSERSPRDYSPQPVVEGCCPSLVFESRFESGNLRQARRIGMFEYELILKTDLYTSRHTQWYFFRLQNAQPGVTYQFRIVNLLKSDSLYNYGMRPLVYSEKDSAEKQTGWIRTGHHIAYTKNITNLTSPLLSRAVPTYMLEWQMEFSNADDTYYLAHCYPYTFTDLKDDLDVLLASPERKACIRREVLCESRAGNSCFLITVTNFEKKDSAKKVVVITARVHPGESQASWMMKGFLEYITANTPLAQELREKFIFKLVPMLNPDGVIVGNYRCSLAARDLNRNFRHPRRENFPTIYSLKAMVEELAQKYEIMLYCDLHGHSRKHNVFMYGNNTSLAENDSTGVGAAKAFISERLFPWLMSSTCRGKFSFRSCKFQIRRCKESTGRVVMWRQLNIQNSFTLEATFSGTTLDKANCRHFNVQDLMEVGSGLAKTVLAYHSLQQDKTLQTETVLELTKAITEQILETRGLIQPNSSLPDFLLDKNLMETDAQAVQEDAEKWTSAMLTLLQQPSTATDHSGAAAADLDKGQGRRDERVSRRSGLSKEEASKLLDRVSLSTMDGCLNILAALNVPDALQESDSSDSDSESEPELKLVDSKPRKKKRKSRKQRDRDLNESKKQVNSDKRGDEKDKEYRLKTLSALPALLCAEAPSSNAHGHAFSTGSASFDSASILTSAQLAKRQAGCNSVLERLNKERRSCQFQSKYEGRHNGGVPCFTQERSQERAAKRVAEMKKKCDDDRHRDVSLMCIDEQTLNHYPTQMYPHILTQEDFNHRLNIALSEGTASLSKTLMGMNVRTGYTHADNLQDLHPTVNGSGYLLAAHLATAQTGSVNGSSQGHTAERRQRCVHTQQENERENSWSDDSDSGSEMVKSQSAAVPICSRRSPYHQQELLQRSPTLTSWPLKPASGNHSNSPLSTAMASASVAKRPVRYKTSHGLVPRRLLRHSSQGAPLFIASGIQPISRDPPRHYDSQASTVTTAATTQAPKLSSEKPQYDRSRIGRGPLMRGLRQADVQQGFTWE